MQVIKNNPYRTIGLLAGTSLRDQTRQANRLKQFVDADQEVTDDFSFPVFGKVIRTNSSIEEAVAKLNLNSDRINAALFWFCNGSHIDEASFDKLKDNNIQEAVNIWERRTASGEVSSNNLSAFQNLSTLKLFAAFNNITINPEILEEGISLKLKFLESEFVNEFKEKITDNTYKFNRHEVELFFLGQVQNEAEKSNGLSSQKLLEIINRQSFGAKEEFLNKCIQKPITQIEKNIEESRAKRKANKSDALKTGNNLYNECRVFISSVKSILGISNFKYSSISDKLSDEILQCGIDYFTRYRDTSMDPGSDTMDLFRKAKLLAVGSVARQRCQENTEHLQKWIDEKPERDKQNKIKFDFETLLRIFNEFENKSETIENAKSLITSCKLNLTKIKTTLGSTDDLYLKLSTRIASQAQSYVVEEINRVQELVVQRTQTMFSQYEKMAYINTLKEKLYDAWQVTILIGSLDMENDFRVNRYNRNKDTLQGLCNQLGIRTSGNGKVQSKNSTSTYRTATNTNTRNAEDIPEWVKWIGGIILFIILAKACN